MSFKKLLHLLFGPKKVGTINNVTVYSNKRVKNITNTLITFEDGSSCDVATGKIVNKGTGTILMESEHAHKNGTSKQVAYSNIKASGSITIGSIEQTSSSSSVTQTISEEVHIGS